jgi:hypothetical protein
MAFTWTQTIGQNAKDIAAAINEIRTNVDYLKDNMSYCAAHFDTDLSAYKSTHQATNYATHKTNVNTSVLATYYSSNCGSNYPANYNPYYSTDDLSYWINAGGTFVATCTQHHGKDNSTVLNSYNGAYFPSECFPAGTKVLMFDGRILSIENIKPNDNVMSFFGKANRVLDIQVSKLGSQMMFGFSDGSLVYTSAEQLWAKNSNDEFWAVSDYNSHVRGAGNDWEINGTVYKRHGIRRRGVIVQVDALDYAHVMGWKKQFPIVRREFGSDAVIYSLILDGDYTHFVNGYITNGGVSDEVIDFSTYKWNGLNRGE